jgi:hypothetical protein
MAAREGLRKNERQDERVKSLLEKMTVLTPTP